MHDSMLEDEAALSMRFAELYSKCQEDFQALLISARGSAKRDADYANGCAQLFEGLFRLRSIGVRLRAQRRDEAKETSRRTL